MWAALDRGVGVRVRWVTSRGSLVPVLTRSVAHSRTPRPWVPRYRDPGFLDSLTRDVR
jgi:hypothetical protein